MFLNIGTKTEIGDFDCSVEAKQHVVWLNISVYDSFLMEKTDSAQRLKLKKYF